MFADSDHTSALESFADEGWISEILYEVKSGKEATVFCCRGGALAPAPLVAAKVYRPIKTRRFKNDAMYVGGRLHMARPGRAKRAVQAKSAFGRPCRLKEAPASLSTAGTFSGLRMSGPRVIRQSGMRAGQKRAKPRKGGS